jgi:hypothetical protein
MAHVEISSAYKRLQADKIAVDKIVRELTPLNGIGDLEAFESHLKNLNGRTEVRVV